MKKIAVTGSVSCGKSSVCRFLKECGAEVVSADEIVHQLLSPNTSLGKEVFLLLGSSVITDGTFDRKKIAEMVFNSPPLLKALENILHPAVREEISKLYKECKAPLFVAEVPLLFESGSNVEYDAVVLVSAPLESCQERFTRATGYDKNHFKQRMARLMNSKEKECLANRVISNNGSLEDLRQKTNELYKDFT